jgi:hypothetical protein
MAGLFARKGLLSAASRRSSSRGFRSRQSCSHPHHSIETSDPVERGKTIAVSGAAAPWGAGLKQGVFSD